MKHFYNLVTLAAILWAVPAAAQISIDDVDASEQGVEFPDRLRPTSVVVDFFSLPRFRAERAAIRNERNYLEFSAGLQGTLTSYNDPWISVSGGDNSIAVAANLSLKHTFKKNDFFIETKAKALFGYNRMKVESAATDADGNAYTHSEGIWFKNQDEFEVSTAPSFKMTKNWSYGMIAKFRSQFAKGYVSRTEQESKDLKSHFMTPAYLDVSLGFTYTSPTAKFPVVINLSPIAMNATYARSPQIRKVNGFNYGIEDPDMRHKYEGGSSIQVDFDRTFGKTGFLRYRTMVYAFYGWITDIDQHNKIGDYHDFLNARDEWIAAGSDIKSKPRLPIHPVVRWTNTIDIKATKYLSTTFNFELYYNRAQNVKVQTKMLLSVGLSYTFKNK